MFFINYTTLLMAHCFRDVGLLAQSLQVAVLCVRMLVFCVPV